MERQSGAFHWGGASSHVIHILWEQHSSISTPDRMFLVPNQKSTPLKESRGEERERYLFLIYEQKYISKTKSLIVLELKELLLIGHLKQCVAVCTKRSYDNNSNIIIISPLRPLWSTGLQPSFATHSDLWISVSPLPTSFRLLLGPWLSLSSTSF